MALLERATSIPPGGASLLSVMVNAASEPPGTLTGSMDTEESAGSTPGITVAVADWLVELSVAVMVTGVEAVTAVVCTRTLALVRREWTVTLAGTDNTVLLLDSITTTPLVGAGRLSVTLTVAEAPPVMVSGFTVTPVSIGSTTGATVRFTIALVEL